MTVIAYKNWILAADSQSNSSFYDVAYTANKVYKAKWYAVALAGTFCRPDICEYLHSQLKLVNDWGDWEVIFSKLENILSRYSKTNSNATIQILVIPKGNNKPVLIQTGDYTYWEYMETEFIAIWSGTDYALWAMECWASAKQACNVAVKYSNSCWWKILTYKI